jgi:hypothetical protein
VTRRHVAFAWAVVAVITAIAVAVVLADSPTADIPRRITTPAVVPTPSSQPGPPVPQKKQHPCIGSCAWGADR